MKQIVWFLALICVVVLQLEYAYAKNDVIVRKAPLMDFEYEKIKAVGLLNDIRESMGMNALTLNDQLSFAAQAHASYLVRNHVTSHSEIEGRPGFTGKTPSERALHVGYLSTQVSENLSTRNHNAQSSIDGLFSAIYHRFAFLDVGIDEIGVGVEQNARERENSAFVYLMGNNRLNELCKISSFKGYGKYVYRVCKNKEHKIALNRFLEAKNASKKENPKIVYYPYDGQQDVPPAFYGEIPDPLPDYDVSGFPVSVTFNDYYFKKVDVISFKLYKNSNRLVPHVRVLTKRSDPHARFTAYQFALFPLKRLAYDTNYRAELVYREKGKVKHVSWVFHTRKLAEKMFAIRSKEGTVTIRKGRGIQVYLVPLDPHDVIKGVTFPEDVDVTFIDNNTLRVTLLSDRTRAFDIKSRNRTIHVKVK